MKLICLLVLFCCLASCELLAQMTVDTTQALVKQDLFHTRRTRINAYPYVSYTPETLVNFGVGGIMTFYTAQDRILRPSKLVLSGSYSTLGQYIVRAAPQFYFTRNRFFLSADVQYGYFVDKFWGIGNDTPDIAEPSYTSNKTILNLEFQFPSLLKLARYQKGAIIYDLLVKDIQDIRNNPYLENPTLTGQEGGISSGIGLGWVWDNRDHIFFPNDGVYSRLKFYFYDKTLGSHFTFQRIEIDIRSYRALWPDHVLAFQLYTHLTGGETPFYQMADIGGSQVMRGFYKGRYRDKNTFAAQIEYRQYFWWRLGVVAFAGLGDVVGRIGDFKMQSLKFSWGGGLRLKFNKAEKVNLRADFGFGRDTRGVYFGLEEAF